MHEPSTAKIIEAWRHDPAFNQLNQLAAWDHQIPNAALINEFIDILNFIKKQWVEKKINEYIAKSRKHGLSFAERVLLQKLLKQRHQTIDAV